jgi:hypothetical protein
VAGVVKCARFHGLYSWLTEETLKPVARLGIVGMPLKHKVIPYGV